jgi:hypothetical protein
LFWLLDLRYKFGDPLVLLFALLPPLTTYALLEGHGVLQSLLVLDPDSVLLLPTLLLLVFLALLDSSIVHSNTSSTASEWYRTDVCCTKQTPYSII